MDPDAALECRVRHVCVHRVENAMDGLVAVGPEDGAAEDPLRFRIDDDFHETKCLAFLDRAPDARHRSGADEEGPASFARAALVEPGAAKGWIDVERVARDSVPEAATVTVEQVRRHDLEIV